MLATVLAGIPFIIIDEWLATMLCFSGPRKKGLELMHFFVVLYVNPKPNQSNKKEEGHLNHWEFGI